MVEFSEYTQKFEGGNYLVSPAFRDIPDEEQLGPAKESHIQYLGYNIITHMGEIDVVNYTWIDSKDHIRDIINESVKKAIINSQNLKNAIFVGNKKIELEVNVTCGVLELVRSLLGFLKNNANNIKKIVFKGYIEAYGFNEIIHICNTFGVSSEILENKVERDSYIQKFKNYK